MEKNLCLNGYFACEAISIMKIQNSIHFGESSFHRNHYLEHIAELLGCDLTDNLPWRSGDSSLSGTAAE
jgi:hypothetical protein